MGRKPKAKQFAREGGPIRERELSLREEQELEQSQFEYTPYQAANPFHLSAEQIQTIREYGFHVQWCVETVLGQPQDEIMTARRKNKFHEVVKGNFGGLLDHLCDRDGVVRKGGQVLMGRPRSIEEQAKDYERRQAKRPITTMRQKHAEEGVDVPMPGGGKHKSALAHNRHRTEMARIEIPEE